jgi:hypothetical protein
VGNNKRYYNENFKVFNVLTRTGAKQFQTIQEVYDTVKTFNGNYHSLNDLGVEWTNYTIIVGEFRLTDVWASLAEASLICDGLNAGLNKPIFKIKENIFLESFLMKE